MSIVHREESYSIMGACFEVYKEKGCGFLESVYQGCLEIEFELRGMPFKTQIPLPLFYKKIPLKHTYVPDFVCFGKIVVEIKAVERITDEHRAQVFNYLKATGYQLGLLVNFGHFPQLEYERVVL